jgi:hypothetical protein
MSEYNLNSPWLSITFDGRPRYWKALSVAFFAVTLAVTATLVYLYAMVLPQYIGFERTLLAGVGLIAVTVGGDT